MKRLVALILAVALAGVSVACDKDRTVTPPGPTASGSTPTGTPSDGPGPSPTGWTTGPTTVNRTLKVPPVPQLVGIRAAAHPEGGYDRITFDISGDMPGYDIRYVDKVLSDPANQPVNLPGRKYLVILIRPTDAHNASGTSTVAKSQTLNFPMLKGYVLAGDFESVVTIALGLDDISGYRVGELPGRIYVDVAA